MHINYHYRDPSRRLQRYDYTWQSLLRQLIDEECKRQHRFNLRVRFSTFSCCRNDARRNYSDIMASRFHNMIACELATRSYQTHYIYFLRVTDLYSVPGYRYYTVDYVNLPSDATDICYPALGLIILLHRPICETQPSENLWQSLNVK